MQYGRAFSQGRAIDWEVLEDEYFPPSASPPNAQRSSGRVADTNIIIGAKRGADVQSPLPKKRKPDIYVLAPPKDAEKIGAGASAAGWQVVKNTYNHNYCVPPQQTIGQEQCYVRLRPAQLHWRNGPEDPGAQGNLRCVRKVREALEKARGAGETV